MLFLWKIDKMSFYHHYFRIIQEVEVRNSTQVSAKNYWALMHSTKLILKTPIVLFLETPVETVQKVLDTTPLFTLPASFSYQLAPRAP
ncbi:MAG: hypothetical protein AAF655_00550 [Bacteroidota bacterium]